MVEIKDDFEGYNEIRDWHMCYAIGPHESFNRIFK
jgi:hypothetical protein